MRFRGRAHLWVLAGALAFARGAHAATPEPPPLARDEQASLLGGGRVVRPLRFETSSGRYVGGLGYQIVRATPDQVVAALSDAKLLPKLLPHTHAARLLAEDGDQRRIELEQGSFPFVARYVVELHRGERPGELRFWLDPRAPHDIEDAWGYFRAERFDAGHTLLTVGLALDLGPGVVRALFEDRVQAVVLRSVSTIRNYLEARL